MDKTLENTTISGRCPFDRVVSRRMATATIRIRELRRKVRLGCNDQERRHPQMVVINLEAQLGEMHSCSSDKITDTVSYITISDEISRMCEEGEWRLVEKLAWDLTAGLLKSFPKLSGVLMCIKKNVLESASGAEIQLHLTQDDVKEG